jgi:hypothetical protein
MLTFRSEVFGQVVERIYPVSLRISPHDMKLMWMRVLSLDADGEFLERKRGYWRSPDSRH